MPSLTVYRHKSCIEALNLQDRKMMDFRGCKQQVGLLHFQSLRGYSTSSAVCCCCYSADGKYEVSYKPNVVIRSEGDVLWIPPAIYRSSCPISVKYFPFDEQTCKMKFGSWTFNSDQVLHLWDSRYNVERMHFRLKGARESACLSQAIFSLQNSNTSSNSLPFSCSQSPQGKLEDVLTSLLCRKLSN